MKIGNWKLEIPKLTHRHRQRVVVAAILLLAFFLRWKHYMVFPAFRDELGEADFAWRIYRGERPLTGLNTYSGPYYFYFLALLMKIFGPSLLIPRTVSLIFGVATVYAIYLLAKKLVGEWGAYVAMLLTALQPFHILINSRVSWSNCLTPFFTTMAVYFFLCGQETLARSDPHWEKIRPEPGKGRISLNEHKIRPKFWFGAAGIMLGLALNSHPSTLAFAAVLGLWISIQLLRDRTWLRSFVAFTATTTVLMIPLLIYNVQSRLGSIEGVQVRSYALESEYTPQKYLQNLTNSNRQMVEVLSHKLVLDGRVVEKEEIPEIVKWATKLIPWLAVVGLGFLILPRKIRQI